MASCNWQLQIKGALFILLCFNLTENSHGNKPHLLAVT